MTLACGYFNSGARVFDIRNPTSPKEIAYYNPVLRGDPPRTNHPASEPAKATAERQRMSALSECHARFGSSFPKRDRFVGDQAGAI